MCRLAANSCPEVPYQATMCDTRAQAEESDHITRNERRSAQRGGESQRLIEGLVAACTVALVVDGKRSLAFPAAVAHIQVRNRLAPCETGAHGSLLVGRAQLLFRLNARSFNEFGSELDIGRDAFGQFPRRARDRRQPIGEHVLLRELTILEYGSDVLADLAHYRLGRARGRIQAVPDAGERIRAPCSAVVLTSGKKLSLALPAIAKGFSFPALMCCPTTPYPPLASCTSPAIAAPMESETPLYGTVRMSVRSRPVDGVDHELRLAAARDSRTTALAWVRLDVGDQLTQVGSRKLRVCDDEEVGLRQ